MVRRLLVGFMVVTVVTVTTMFVLYQFFGLRVRMDGGGNARLTFVVDAAAQADIVARHREEQRRTVSGAVASTGSAETAEPPAAPPQSDSVSPSPAAAPTPPEPYWTDFRGPLRDGHYRQRPIRTAWPAGGLEPVWKQPIGGGYASFVIARNRAFTIEQRGPREVVAAYDMRTGRELWTNGWDALFSESLGGDGPRATPTWADGVVYALGGTGEMRALDENQGRTIWRTNILDDNRATNLDWGMAASPLTLAHQGALLCLSERMQREEELLNAAIDLLPPSAWRESEAGGVPLAIGDAVEYLDHLGVEGDSRVDPTDAQALRRCFMRIETAPKPESRVTLEDRETDALGMRRSRLTLVMGTLESRTVVRTTEIVARELGARQGGRLLLTLAEGVERQPVGGPGWVRIRGGSHHMGTTRMSDTPATGVVDRDCRVHGVPNLYVAGSSVFPTCGMANPTFTIVALALRMAEHMAARLAGG